MLKKILTKFNGLHFPQEYLCFGEESFTDPLHAYLFDGRKATKDITKLHCFIGYHPLVFALNSNEAGNAEHLDIIFAKQALKLNEETDNKLIIATLRLKKTNTYGDIVFYEGERATHKFINRLHQKVGGFINNRYSRKPGNVFLDNKLYRQVQVAYAIPRKISLITVSSVDLFNHFPTDLHGPIDENTYIISLRHEGLACKQVVQSGKIVLCDIKAAAYQKVYALGKNHMQPLKPIEHFNFSPIRSSDFGLPLAQDAVSYKELELIHSFNHGIHKVLVFRIVNFALVNYFGPDPLTWFEDPPAETLVHVHNVYATWRHKNGLKSNYLLR